MCTIWTMDEWRKQDQNKESSYHILAEYTNSQGETALTIQQDVTAFNTRPSVRNVYSQDGIEEQTFRYGSYDANIDDWPERSHDEQLKMAAEEMAVHGFTIPVVRVQGRSIAEWKHEGDLNESRTPNEHVHPTPPVDRDPTEEELEALAASSTVAEAMYILDKMLDQMLIGVGASA